MEQKIKAYKAFDKDLSCRGFKYEVGKEYGETGDIKACEKGFHACPYPLDVFGYYTPLWPFSSQQRISNITRELNNTLELLMEILVTRLLKRKSFTFGEP